MDDSLEAPSAVPIKASLGDEPPADNDEQSSDEEDGGLDWTKLLPASARPIIPRRGEKEFEPRSGGGTNLQIHVLDRSRLAMFDALRTTRTISSKAISYAIWHPDISRTQVTVARGIHFSNMGHSAPRSSTGKDGILKTQKQLELLPEEAIYLIERGSLFCWKQTNINFGEVSGLQDVEGCPMTVQQAFSEMIGREDLTIDKFQAYAYLKRLGYVVTRADPPDSYYPMPPSFALPEPTTLLQRIKSIFPLWVSTVSRVLSPAFSWWKPVCVPRWLARYKNYTSLFRSMRFIPAGHSVPLKTSASIPHNSPYRIFYNVYKPSTPFRKSSPPPPDFRLVVINARTTPMPTLQELNDLFDVLPEAPLPTPRQRRPPIGNINNISVAAQPWTSSTTDTSSQSFVRQMFSWFFVKQPPTSPAARKPNPFMALKSGKKIIIVAAVDNGSTSFFRFGQGEFMEWPMI